MMNVLGGLITTFISRVIWFILFKLLKFRGFGGRFSYKFWFLALFWLLFLSVCTFRLLDIVGREWPSYAVTAMLLKGMHEAGTLQMNYF